MQQWIYLIVPATAWLAAGIVKLLVLFSVTRKLSPSVLFQDGGFPSAHSASTVSLAMYIGIKSGFPSESFAMAALLAVIVMRDAVGIRRSAGKQASVLNNLLAHLLPEQQGERLREILGHTPVDVIGGLLVGFVISLIFATRIDT